MYKTPINIEINGRKSILKNCRCVNLFNLIKLSATGPWCLEIVVVTVQVTNTIQLVCIESIEYHTTIYAK